MPERDEARTTYLPDIVGVQQGDEAAWGRFSKKYTPRLVGWCRACGLQETDAFDVSQEVLLKVFKAIGAYDTTRKFKPWLREIWRNTFIDLKRKKCAATAAESAVWRLLPDDGPDLTDELIEQEVMDKARAAVKQEVKAAHWDIYQAHDIEREDSSALAARLGLTQTNVCTICLRVRKKMARQIQILGEE